MPFVLAIEPDARQGAVVRRILRQRVRVDSAVVDSKDAAIASIDRRPPDLILLSALFSPRDEADLFEHLRQIGAPAHLQSLTIPLLAASARAREPKTRGGLFTSLRRKKSKSVPDGYEGCDPEIFAEQISGYLRDVNVAAQQARPPEDIESEAAPAPAAETPDMASAAPAVALAASAESSPALADALEVPAADVARAFAESSAARFGARPTDKPPHGPALVTLAPVAAEATDAADIAQSIDAWSLTAPVETAACVGVADATHAADQTAPWRGESEPLLLTLSATAWPEAAPTPALADPQALTVEAEIGELVAAGDVSPGGPGGALDEFPCAEVEPQIDAGLVAAEAPEPSSAPPAFTLAASAEPSLAPADALEVGAADVSRALAESSAAQVGALPTDESPEVVTLSPVAADADDIMENIDAVASDVDADAWSLTPPAETAACVGVADATRAADETAPWRGEREPLLLTLSATAWPEAAPTPALADPQALTVEAEIGEPVAAGDVSPGGPGGALDEFPCAEVEPQIDAVLVAAEAPGPPSAPPVERALFLASGDEPAREIAARERDAYGEDGLEVVEAPVLAGAAEPAAEEWLLRTIDRLKRDLRQSRPDVPAVHSRGPTLTPHLVCTSPAPSLHAVCTSSARVAAWPVFPLPAGHARPHDGARVFPLSMWARAAAEFPFVSAIPSRTHGEEDWRRLLQDTAVPTGVRSARAAGACRIRIRRAPAAKTKRRRNATAAPRPVIIVSRRALREIREARIS